MEMWKINDLVAIHFLLKKHCVAEIILVTTAVEVEKERFHSEHTTIDVNLPES